MASCIKWCLLCVFLPRCVDLKVAAEVSIAIRLQGPMSANGTGRVEVFYKGEWGTICDDDWDINDAKVVCRQLGYQYGSRAFHGNNIDPGSGKIWLDDVDCNGSEKNVTSCSHAGWGNHDCTHDEDAGVECLTAGTRNDVRLRGPLSGNGIGRVEVFYRKHWGLICSYGWDINGAMVVCRQLGYKYAVRTFEEQGRPWLGQIWLDDVNCTGNEKNLTSCSHRVWRSGFGCQDRRIGSMAAVECSSTGPNKSSTVTQSTSITITPTSATSIAGGGGQGLCQKMDIIFVLDRSSSIGTSDYDLMRKFLLSLGEKLRIGERNSKGEIVGQGAIVTFSEKGTTRITLSQSQQPGRFATIVKNMPGPLAGGRTKTHQGINVADKKVAVKSAGYREDDPNVAKIFMVITDGKQTRESRRRGYKYVREAMQPFFRRDMNVFAVGVGLRQEAAKKQVRDMVENPDNAILAKDFKELTETVNNFIAKFCPVDKVCGTPKDDCHEHATCTDLEPGKYECKCNLGYSGDGKTCMAIAIAFDSLTYDVREGDKKAIVGISVASGEITSPLTMNFNTQFDTAGEGDFTAVSRSITLQPGHSGPLFVEIDIADDTQVESTESFQVSLSDPSYSVQIGQPATVSILDNDGNLCND